MLKLKLMKEWNDVEQMSEVLIKAFDKWRVSNLIITHGSGRKTEDIFGLPYTSSSSYAAIWNCQAEACYKFCPQWNFEALAISEEGYFVAIFSNENETFDRMQIVIGRA